MPKMDVDPGTSHPVVETAPLEGAPARIIVDTNNPEIKIESTKMVDKRVKVINFVAQAHYNILERFGLHANDKNLSLGDQVHNILFTSFNINQQVSNKTGETLQQRLAGMDYKITFANQDYSCARPIIDDIVVAAAKEAGIPFGKFDQNSEENWYGAAKPLLYFLSGFALRRKELRLGRHTMPIGKLGQTEKVVNLFQYGIYGCHHVLCEGITFPPEKRAAMAQSLGPVTALLCYLKSERRFSQKWLPVAKRAFAHFPGIDTVLSMIRDRDATEVRPLIMLMCDIALITTPRQARRLFPPPAAFSYIFRRASHRIGNNVFATSNLTRLFNFSGHGWFAFYKVFQSIEWSLNLNNSSDSQAKQIVYHCMFGTCKEDLLLLTQITNQATWETREQLGKVLQRSNTTGGSIQFKPVQQIYYAKLAQASQTGLLTSSDTQMSSQPCFSGRVKRKFSDAFFDYLSPGTTQMFNEKSLQAFISSYSYLKEKLLQQKKQVSFLSDKTVYHAVSSI